jgi:hypothetical protein
MIISFVSTIVYSALCIFKKAPAKEVVKANMIVKLVHIPAYVLIFLFSLLLSMMIIFTLPLLIMFALLDLYFIIQTGIIGAVSTIRTSLEGNISTVEMVFCGISQFIYCIDVVVAVILYVKIKKRSKIDVAVA